jgi:hypothetical protein
MATKVLADAGEEDVVEETATAAGAPSNRIRDSSSMASSSMVSNNSGKCHNPANQAT